MARTRKPRQAVRSWRMLSFQAAFAPAGDADTDATAFRDFFQAATEHAITLQQENNRQRKARLLRLKAARRKTDPVLAKVLRNELPVAEGAQIIRRLVPDQELMRELYEVWKQAAQTTPEHLAEQKREIKHRERELQRSEQWHQATKAILNGLITLSDGAEVGDPEAARQLVEAAVQAAVFVGIAERRHPELFKTVARMKGMWPVLATDEPGWENEAVQRMEELGLRSAFGALKARFRKTRGADANLPARQWAKAAVRAIEGTLVRMATLEGFVRKFGSREALVEFMQKTGWHLGKFPRWATPESGLSLMPFCKTTLPQWKPVVRQLVRDQVPDFHLRPEWATQRNSATARGRATPGEIQNAILDDICSALERIAPDKGC